MAINRIFGAISISQGTGSLTNIESLAFNDNDMAIVRANSNETTGGHDAEYDGIYFYRWESSRTDTHNEPYTIKPDNLSDIQSGRWMLISPTHFMETLVVEPSSSIIVNEIVGNDAGLILGFNTNGPVLTLNIEHAGSGFTNGTYLAEPTSSTGGGTGLTLDVTVATEVVTVVVVDNGGSDYIKYDDITLDNFVGAELKVSSVGNISIKILDTEIQMIYDTRFFGVPSFEYSSGAPFSVAGNQTLVTDVNAELHGGELISNISLLDDNTYKYSVLPQVTDPLTVVPVVDADLVTVKYLSDILTDASMIDHGNLGDLLQDDHTQYVLVTGDRVTTGFTGVISGIYPTLISHLTTKGYVDDEITALGLGGSGSYLYRDGTTTATAPILYDIGVDFATLDAGDGQKFSSVNYVKTSITNHTSDADPHTQYLRNDGDDATLGHISSITSTATAHLTTRQEIDSYMIDVFTNQSYADVFTDVGTVSYTSNIVRKNHPESNNLLYTQSVLESGNESLINYSYLAVRMINLLEFDDSVAIGQVKEVSITTAGTGYSTGVVSPTGGSGTGFGIEILSIGGSGEILTIQITGEGVDYLNSEVLTVPGGTSGTVTLNEVVRGASHDDLFDLDVDTHTQYILADSSRVFNNTGVYYPRVSDSSINPFADEHLTTKKYVDDLVGAAGTVTNVNALTGSVDIYDELGAISTYPSTPSTGLAAGGSTAVASTPFHQIPFLSSTSFATHLTDPASDYVNGYELTTKAYVDDAIAGGVVVQGVVVTTGDNPLLNNQIYSPKYPHDYFLENQDGQSDSGELVNKGYVDSYLGLILNSDNDEYMSYFAESVSSTGWTSSLDTTVNDGSATGIIVENRYALQGAIARVSIVDGGSGYFSVDPTSALHPQTIGTGSSTNFPTFDAAGTGTTYTETSIELDETGNTTADIRPNKIIGDIGIVEIQNAGTGYDVGDVIYFSGDGKDATWIVTTIGASGEITGVQRNAAQTLPYTFTVVSAIYTVGGSGAVLEPYIVGEIVSFERYDTGTGYTGASFRYAPGSIIDDGFTWAGYGTTTGDSDDNGIDITFINPRDEKMNFEHYGSGTLTTAVGASPFIVTSGNIINSITFDEWGHITDVSEAGTPFGVWVEIDETDSPFATTQNYNYFVDVSTSAVEMRLAASPILGNTIMIDDVNENSSTNNITVNDSTGANLLVAGSSATPTVIDMDGVRIILIYVNATYGWRLKTI